MAETCPNCGGERWVCEEHPTVPWTGAGDECCGGAGMPCRICNPCDENNPPALSPGFRVICQVGFEPEDDEPPLETIQ